MSQLPLMPLSLGGKALIQSADGSVAPQVLAPEGQIEGSVFAETLCQALELSGEEMLSILGMTIALPVEATRTVSQPVQDGNLLPDQLVPSGQALPLPIRQYSPPEVELTGPALIQESKPELLVGKLVGQVERPRLGLDITPYTEGSRQTIDLHRGGEWNDQPSLKSLQVLHGSVPNRSVSFTQPVDLPVGQPGWDKAVGEKIQWMIGSKIQNAEVKLTPPHLGPLEIRVSVQNDQTSVSFIAAQLPTREALEAAIPRLREMLGEANLNLVDVGVGQGGGSDAGSDQHAEAAGGRHDMANMQSSSLTDPQGTTLTRIASDGIVDDYA